MWKQTELYINTYMSAKFAADGEVLSIKNYIFI